MKTAIVYMSKHGTTEKTAKLIAEYLSEDSVEFYDLHEDSKPDLTHFEKIIVGGSIHMGKIQKEVRKFCDENRDLLMDKVLGLFICCMAPEPEKQQTEFEAAFPSELRAHSKANGILGGEFLFEKMNFLERMVVKKVSGADKSVSKINIAAIQAFTKSLK